MMDRIEQYIKSNRGEFDSELPPAGSRDRFLARLEALENAGRVLRKSSVRKVFVCSAAAAVAALVIVAGLSAVRNENALEKSIMAMAKAESDMIAYVRQACPHEMDYVIPFIRSITAEAVPLSEQLPEELPSKEKVRILKDYYDRKTEALKHLMACYCNEITINQK